MTIYVSQCTENAEGKLNQKLTYGVFFNEILKLILQTDLFLGDSSAVDLLTTPEFLQWFYDFGDPCWLKNKEKNHTALTSNYGSQV